MYNLNSNDGEKHLIINLPKDLNFKDLFPTFTTKQLFATQFIVNQINHFSYYKKKQGYSFNVVTHSKFLGLNRNFIYQIISTLTDNSIIEMVQNYKVGERNRCFKMVNPYSDQNSIQIFFKRSEPKNYNFINEFIDNGYRITPNDENIIEQKEIIVEEKNRIEQLEQEIKELKQALNKALQSTEKPEQVNQQVIIKTPLEEMITTENDVTGSEVDEFEFRDEESGEIFNSLGADNINYIKLNIYEGVKLEIDDKYIVKMCDGKLQVA